MSEGKVIAGIIGIGTATIEMQQTRIDELKEEIARLKSELETLKIKYADLELYGGAYYVNHKLSLAITALEEINREEIRSQRPGGGHSRSATISYEALEKIKGKE
jgi:hypothetical protein